MVFVSKDTKGGSSKARDRAAFTSVRPTSHTRRAWGRGRKRGDHQHHHHHPACVRACGPAYASSDGKERPRLARCNPARSCCFAS